MDVAQKKTNILLKDIIGTKMSADKLLNKLGLTDPPFNPFEIAAKLGLTVNQKTTMDDLEESGSVAVKDGEVNIWINTFDIEGRQRFTLAHELAHLINDISLDKDDRPKDYPKKLYRGVESNDRETKANKFAGELLMPKKQFISHANEIIKKYGTTTNNGNSSIPLRDLTLRLADIFQVTEPAVFVRLKVVGMIK